MSEAVKSLTRKVKGPNQADMQSIKRLGHYLPARPGVVNVFNPSKEGTFCEYLVIQTTPAVSLLERAQLAMQLAFGSVV